MGSPGPFKGRRFRFRPDQISRTATSWYPPAIRLSAMQANHSPTTYTKDPAPPALR